MTTRELAAVLHARPTASGGYIFRCPAHDDRSPSGSLHEGHSGRTVVYCWAGCSADAIVQAIGLSLSDLFEKDDRQSQYVRHSWFVRSRIDVKGELAAAAQEKREALERSGIYGELTTSELNAIRERVGTRCGANLPPLERFAYEGGHGGRERDPLWPLIFESAWIRVCVDRLGAPLPALSEFAAAGLRPPRSLLILAEQRAARIMRYEERQALNYRRINAA